ncbi:MAG: pilus assembly protein TadG-related protein [Pseudomonadota bacterium]
MSIWQMLWTAIFLMIGGAGVDYANAVRALSHLQATSDAAALAGAADLPDIAAALSGAQTYAALNAPTEDFGQVAPDTAIVVGFYNFVTDTFTASAKPRNAVRVRALRTRAGGNALDTVLLKLAGWTALDIGAQSMAVAQADRCPGGALMSQAALQVDAVFTAPGDFCVSGSAITLGPGGPPLAPPEPGPGLPIAADPAFDTLAALPGIVADLRAGRIDALPEAINASVSLGAITPDIALSPGTLYRVSGAVDLGGYRTLRDVALVADGDIAVGPNVVLQNVVLVGDGAITFQASASLGTIDHCPGGTFSTYVFAAGDLSFGPLAQFDGALLASGGALTFAGPARRLGSLHAEAAGPILLPGAAEATACADRLVSHFDTGAGRQRLAN